MPGKFPNTLEKRELLHSGQSTPEKLNALAESYISEKRYSEALLFFSAAKNAARMESLKNKAIEFGNLYLYSAACRELGQPENPAEKENLAASAERRGLMKYAERARFVPEKMVEDEDGVEEGKTGEES